MIKDLGAYHCPGEMFSKKAGKLQTGLSKYVRLKIRPNCYKKGKVT